MMITPLDAYDLASMSPVQMDQAIRDLEQDVEELEWEIEWRRRELGALRASIAQIRVRRWQAS